MAWGYGEEPRLSVKWALALGNWCGISHGDRLRVFVATMTAESGRYPEAWHQNMVLDADGLPTDEVSSTDRGLMQINDRYHGERFIERFGSIEMMFDPIPNVQYAVDLSNNGRNMSWWAAWKSDAYLRFLPTIEHVWEMGTWRSRVDKVEARFG